MSRKALGLEHLSLYTRCMRENWRKGFYIGGSEIHMYVVI
jgi:hypothetical protein